MVNRQTEAQRLRCHSGRFRDVAAMRSETFGFPLVGTVTLGDRTTAAPSGGAVDGSR